MSWTVICDLDEVPEDSVLQCKIEDIQVLVIRYDDGVRVVPPVCPHMEEPLDDSGIVSDCVLTCTKHLWQWDLNTLEMIGPTEEPLKLYQSKIEDGKILIWFEHELVYDFEEEEELDEDDFFN